MRTFEEVPVLVLALTRRRSLFVAVALVVALTAFTAPALAWTHGHCVQPTDHDHHLPALLEVRLVPVAMPVGVADPVEVIRAGPLLATYLLKVPLDVPHAVPA